MKNYLSSAFINPFNINLYRDKYGRRVLILRLGEWNPDEVTFEQGFCAFYKMAELLALEPKTQVLYKKKGNLSKYYLNNTNWILRLQE